MRFGCQPLEGRRPRIRWPASKSKEMLRSAGGDGDANRWAVHAEVERPERPKPPRTRRHVDRADRDEPYEHTRQSCQRSSVSCQTRSRSARAPGRGCSIAGKTSRRRQNTIRRTNPYHSKSRKPYATETVSSCSSRPSAPLSVGCVEIPNWMFLAQCALTCHSHHHRHRLVWHSRWHSLWVHLAHSRKLPDSLALSPWLLSHATRRGRRRPGDAS
jgi:hypothetical protein